MYISIQCVRIYAQKFIILDVCNNVLIGKKLIDYCLHFVNCCGSMQI